VRDRALFRHQQTAHKSQNQRDALEGQKRNPDKVIDMAKVYFDAEYHAHNCKVKFSDVDKDSKDELKNLLKSKSIDLTAALREFVQANIEYELQIYDLWKGLERDVGRYLTGSKYLLPVFDIPE